MPMTMTLCRLCQRPLRDDRFLVQPAPDPVLDTVHRRCAFDLMHAVAFTEWLATDDAHPNADRWVAFRHELIALDPPRHVLRLIAGLPYADQVAQP